MKLSVIKSFACAPILLSLMTGCGSSSSNTNNTNALPSEPKTTSATTASVCQRVAELACGPSAGDCVTGFERDRNSCKAQPADFQAILNCLQSAPMSCKGSPARPHTDSCLEEYSHVANCANGVPAAFPSTIPDAGAFDQWSPPGFDGGTSIGECTTASDCFAYSCMCQDGTITNASRCTNHACDSMEVVCSSDNKSVSDFCSSHGGVM